MSRVATAWLLAMAAAAAVSGAQAKAKPAPNPNIVIAQLNLWFYGAGPWGGFLNGAGDPVVKLAPALGRYASADPEVLKQQIAWAADHGVDAFSIEWVQPGDSVEKNLDKAFLKASNLCRIRWLIFYDFILRLQTSGIDFSAGVDFDDPQVRSLFVSDVGRFAKRYFKHQQYFAIDGRPVVYLYASWNYLGDVASAVAEARQRAAAEGYDVYLVASEIVADRFDPDHARLWDAVTSFIPFLDAGLPASYSAAIASTDALYSDWRNKVAPLLVAGTTRPVRLQPGFTPQYDDTLFRLNQDPGNPGSPIVVAAGSRAQVATMAQTVLKHARAEGAAKQKILWVNTWNNWAETTTVEPTAKKGAKYPAGNYQLDMLRIIQETFGAQTFGCGG